MKLKNYKILEVYHNSGVSPTTGVEWKSTEVLVSNTDEIIESRMLVRLMPSCAETFTAKKGDFVDMEIIHDTREFNGNFFNRISAWKIKRVASHQPTIEGEEDEKPF